jgi:hypothetical protein
MLYCNRQESTDLFQYNIRGFSAYIHCGFRLFTEPLQYPPSYEGITSNYYMFLGRPRFGGAAAEG